MKLKDVVKTVSGIWDAFDSIAFVLFALFVVAALGLAAVKYERTMDAAFVILLIGATTGILMHRSVLGRIREQHPEVWKSLGSPSFPMNYSVNVNLQVRKFLKSEECASLDDEVLASKIQNERRFGLVYALVLGCVFLLMIVR